MFSVAFPNSCPNEILTGHFCRCDFSEFSVNLLLCSFHVFLKWAKYNFSPSFHKITILDKKLHQVTQVLQRTWHPCESAFLQIISLYCLWQSKNPGKDSNTLFQKKKIGGHLKITLGSNKNFKYIFSSRKGHQRAREPISFVISFNKKGRDNPRYLNYFNQN